MELPNNFLQFKGTDICLDLNCDCGHNTHVDGYFASFIQCPWCNQIYKLSESITMKKVKESELGKHSTPVLIAQKDDDL